MAIDFDILRFWLGQLFSFLSAVSIIVSSIRRKKKKMIFWQFMDSIFITGADFFLGAYSAAAVNFIAINRNTLEIKGLYDRNFMIIFSILITIFGLLANNLGWVGYIAVASALEMTIGLYLAKTDQDLRRVLLLNMILWLIHDIAIKAYPVVLIEIFTIIALSVNLIRLRRKGYRGKNLKNHTKTKKIPQKS